ncbi:MAG: UvrD-helicase domain-containing protein [bacterium]|nr:UvrD-helicase domain-containing protein [bacterium]
MRILTHHQSKALDISKSVSLTANAGSGKTFVLSQRFIEILLSTDTQLNQIAAITFTEKAAGELFKRISEELHKASLQSKFLSLRGKIEKLRKQLVSAKISTIHSFCIDLLKEFPVEASIDANFIPINEQKASELIDLSVESTLNQMLKDPDLQSVVKQLVRLLGSKAKLASELAGMINKRKNVLSLIPKLYSHGVDETANHLFKLFDTNFKLLFERKIPKVIKHISSINDRILLNKPDNERGVEVNSLLKKYHSDQDAIKTIFFLNQIRDLILTSSGSVRSQGYLSSAMRDGLSDTISILEDFFNDLNEIHIDNNYKNVNKELAHCSLAIIQTFQNVNTEYERKKYELGALDFEDILLKTKKLFENKSVSQALSKKYKYLLVDEYQDTNEIQYEIFLPLVDELKSGNLFIVGDEKQSIYRFRDAELQVFSKTKYDIQKINGDESVLTLPDSFRMAPAICSFTNTLFRELFKDPNIFLNEVSASDLVCARTDKFAGSVEFIIADKENESEADLVAKRILSLKRDHGERIKTWNEIAVLVRKRASFAELQKTFIKYQIPFNLIGGTGFYQKQSISDIYNYFSFLLNEQNDVALVGLLRSPFFMISDTDILKLSLNKGESIWEKIKFLSDLNENPWKKVLNTLNENKSLAKRVSIPSLLRKILSESNFISILSSRIDGQQEISNLNKLLSLTNEFFDSEFNTLYDYVTFLDEAISKTEAEAQAQIKAGSDGVNILTIHQAKGLEYSAVFLFKCNDTSQVNKVKARSFTVDKDFGILTKVPVDNNYFGEYKSVPITGIFNIIESKKENAELKRLLYVALTRAKDYLFISMTADDKSFKKNSFAAMIHSGLKQDLNQEQIILEGKLSYLKKDDNNYIKKEESITLPIQILKTLDEKENIFPIQTHPGEKKFFLKRIVDHSRGEVISATRFSTYVRCPLKYNLTYNYKLGELIQHSTKNKKYFKNRESEDFNRSELNSYLLDDESRPDEFSKVKGQFIHYILRKDKSPEELDAYIDQNITNKFNPDVSGPMIQEIKNELKGYYSSNEYSFISAFQNFRNEFEVYLKEGDYYLFGILDKLIIDGKKLIIVDYKTDNIIPNEIQLRAKKYLPQLKFYAYIISRIYDKKYSIEGRIIFTKYPDKPFTFEYDKSSDEEINTGVRNMIQSIRTNKYSVNLHECSFCIFADNNSNCIKSSQNIFS